MSLVTVVTLMQYGNNVMKGWMMSSTLMSKTSLVLAVLGLVAVISLNPLSAFGNGNNKGGGESEIEARVTVPAECNWFVYGIPSKMTLSSQANEKYVGEELPLQDSFNMVVRKSGSNEGASSYKDCSFFGDKERPELVANISDSEFEASYGNGNANAKDSEMDFDVSMDGKSGFKASAGECDANKDVWTAETTKFLQTTTTSLLQFNDLEDVKNVLTEEAHTQVCKSKIIYEVNIPANLTPSNAGETYSYSGPTATITVSYLGD